MKDAWPVRTIVLRTESDGHKPRPTKTWKLPNRIVIPTSNTGSPPLFKAIALARAVPSPSPSPFLHQHIHSSQHTFIVKNTSYHSQTATRLAPSAEYPQSQTDATIAKNNGRVFITQGAGAQEAPGGEGIATDWKQGRLDCALTGERQGGRDRGEAW